MPSATAMESFLSRQRIAVVGVSRDPKQFANALWRALRERGYDTIPVNPHATELEGVLAYPSLRAIPAPVDGAIILLPPNLHSDVIEDAILAHVPHLWFQSPSGPGTSPALTERANQAGVAVINGGCPFMALKNTGWFHRAHATFSRWTGAVQP